MPHLDNNLCSQSMKANIQWSIRKDHYILQLENTLRLQVESQPTGIQYSESSKKQNLNLLQAGHYLHNIYIIFTTISIAFTLY